MYSIENSALQNRLYIRNKFGDPESIAEVVNLVECEQMTRRANTAFDLRKACERLIFAARCRDNTMGDPCRLLEVKAELQAAADAADALLSQIPYSEDPT